MITSSTSLIGANVLRECHPSLARMRMKSVQSARPIINYQHKAARFSQDGKNIKSGHRESRSASDRESSAVVGQECCPPSCGRNIAVPRPSLCAFDRCRRLLQLGHPFESFRPTTSNSLSLNCAVGQLELPTFLLPKVQLPLLGDPSQLWVRVGEDCSSVGGANVRATFSFHQILRTRCY